MSARNHSESSRDAAITGPVPVLQPETHENHGNPEVVWSSPVSTGAGFATSGDAEAALGNPAPEDPEDRCIYAFESDFFDNALVHWNEGENGLTLEMIPGFKKDKPPELHDAYMAESVTSGLADLMTGTLNEAITLVDPSEPAADSHHFQPDATHAAAGPMKVRDDGIEDPVKGWRPTGMVLFETLATPPRGTIYSSSLLNDFLHAASQHQDDSSPDHGAHGKSAFRHHSDHAPFFDFPEVVAPAPPDDTEDFPMEVIVRGGRGGGGGIWIFRMFGKLLLVLLALLGVGFFALLGSYGYYVKQRLYDSEAGRNVTVIVKPGDNFRRVIDSLHQGGVLRGFMGLDDRYIMRYLAYAFENSDQIKPGVYRFDTGQNLQDVYDKLISGSKDFKLTIPEGKTAREVAEQVASNYKNFDVNRFLELVNDPEFTRKLGIDAPSLEGYLYPSTYYFGPGMKEEELIQLMVGTFKGKVEDVQEKLTTTSLTFHQHVIMASLIEREARMDEDRPVIASVIFNRLEKGIPLQIDATVNFALNNWRRLSNADYKTEHPYNTYKIKGLPPGPIASPRIESLVATFQAPETNYLYYVHKGDGHHAFAETYPQHQANVGRYIREKNASGMGNEPAAGAITLQEPPTETPTEKTPSVAEEPAEDLPKETDKEPEPKPDEKSSDKPTPEKSEATEAEKPADDEDSDVKTPSAKSY